MSSIDIRDTSNELITVIDDGKLDESSTSISLFGRGTETYLPAINKNFYALLENFASKKAPNNPIKGQLWYAKKGSNIITVRGTGLNYNASRYIKINNVVKSIKNRRGIALMILDKNFNSTIKSLGYYDIYQSDTARTQLANKLASLDELDIFIMVSYDAIGTNKSLNIQMDKLNSQAWHKIKRNWRYPYTAIGTGKFGIISEDLQGYDDKKHAQAQIAFESLSPIEGMGTHTALTTTEAQNDNLLVFDGEQWGMNATSLDGKDLNVLRQHILSGIDLSVKYDKSGGIINGSMVVDKAMILHKDIQPTGNEIQDLGLPDKRFKSIHLSENNSIYMGPGKEFDKNSFVYTVEKETDSVVNVPAGSLILNRATGEAIVKKSNFVKSLNNNTFRKLSNDNKYGSVIGGNNYNFKGDIGIWMGSWNTTHIYKVSIPTPSNAVQFGTVTSGGHSAGASDGTRGLSFHQHNNDKIKYITISTPMNAIDFGKFSGRWSAAATSDGTRAVVFGGRYNYGHSDYVWFATPMNSVRYGDLGISAHWNSAVSDGTKGIFDSGRMRWNNQQYRYVTLSTPANAIYFGKMQNSRGWTGATSNGIHGLWVGGWQRQPISQIEKLVLNTPSNSVYFGNLTYARHTADPVSNDSTVVAAGGNVYSTILDTISYASGGSAAKFGNAPSGIRYSAYFSGN